MRRGVTLIELIFVIVILGLVGMIAIGTISHFYKGSYYQNQYAQSTAELDRTLTIIERRLKWALYGSIVFFKEGDISQCKTYDETNETDNYTVAFIGIDDDGRRGIWDGYRYSPGWTGEATPRSSGGITILTSDDSNFTLEDQVIQGLSGSSISHAAIYIRSDDSNSCNAFRWTSGATGNTMNKITAKLDDTNLSIVNSTYYTSGQGKLGYYKLAWSGYAFELDGGGNLWLYSNFRPWENDLYTSGTKNLVAQKVSHFAIRPDIKKDNTSTIIPVRVNVCMKEVNDVNSSSNTLSKQVCKEKLIYVGQ